MNKKRNRLEKRKQAPDKTLALTKEGRESVTFRLDSSFFSNFFHQKPFERMIT